MMRNHRSSRGRVERMVLLCRILAFGMVLVMAWECSMKASKQGSEILTDKPSLMEAENTVEEFEALESSGQVFFEAPPEMRSEKANQSVDRIQKASEDVDAYLKRAPDDTSALLLKARVLRALDVAKPKSISMGSDGKPVVSGSSHVPEIQKLLGKVLTKAPDNAPAHYWKARMSALREPMMEEGQFSYRGGDIDQVLFHAKKAVELAPGNITYREYYAQALLAVGRPDESMTLMKDVDGGNHPIYRLQTDWKRIPIPEDAMIDPMMTMSVVQMLQASEEGGNYPNLRVAVFIIPRSAEEVLEFYVSRFGPLTSNRNPGTDMIPVTLEWKGDELVLGEVPTRGNEDNLSGVLLMIGTSIPQEKREAFRIPEGGRSCMLYVNNMRKLAGQ